jgi:hypothetical protein
MTTLTREQIEAMTPEQLRVAVAEYIMGWKWFHRILRDGAISNDLYSPETYMSELSKE